ncbi:hypothetical protein ACWEFL_14205 [Streptomyces sp. NPDC004838]
MAALLAAAPAALVLSPAATTAAYAHDSVTATVIPAVAGPGDEVEIRVNGCKAKTGAAKTRAFDAGAQLYPASGRGDGLVARAKVKAGATPRSYPVTIICDGQGHATNRTIVVPAKGGPAPVAPVKAGGGGTAVLASGPQGDEVQSEGPGTPHAVIGVVLATAAAVAVAFRTSRRRRRTGSD